MEYNLKCIMYPNGSVQVRTYSKTIRTDELRNMRPPNKKKPPSDEAEKQTVKLGKYEERAITESRYRSANRTKQAVFEYARGCVWEWFVTVTFSKEAVNRYDYDECYKKLSRWLNNQRRNAPDLQYLFVPEKHKDGAWHFHGLLAQTGSITFTDSGRKDKHGDEVFNMTAWQNGFTTASRVKDVHRISKYIGKYITKNLVEQTPGRHRYLVSHNMPDAEVYTWLVLTSELHHEALKVADHLDMKIAHVSRTRATSEEATEVTYYELSTEV